MEILVKSSDLYSRHKREKYYEKYGDKPFDILSEILGSDGINWENPRYDFGKFSDLDSILHSCPQTSTNKELLDLYFSNTKDCFGYSRILNLVSKIIKRDTVYFNSEIDRWADKFLQLNPKLNSVTYVLSGNSFSEKNNKKMFNYFLQSAKDENSNLYYEYLLQNWFPLMLKFYESKRKFKDVKNSEK